MTPAISFTGALMFYVRRMGRLIRVGIRDTFEVVEELREHGCPISERQRWLRPGGTARRGLS